MLKHFGISEDLSIHIITSIQHLFIICKLKISIKYMQKFLVYNLIGLIGLASAYLCENQIRYKHFYYPGKFMLFPQYLPLDSTPF